MQRYLLIGLGGCLGSMLRYFIGLTVAENVTTRFPLGTFLINVMACFGLGLALECFQRHAGISAAWRFLIPIGFIGAFSTFSAFEWDAWVRFSSGEFWIGILYVTASVVLGLVAVAAGAAASRALA